MSKIKKRQERQNFSGLIGISMKCYGCAYGRVKSLIIKIKKRIWTKTLNIFLYHVYATYESALAKSFAYIQLKPINKDNRKWIDGYLLHFVLLKIIANVLGNSF